MIMLLFLISTIISLLINFIVTFIISYFEYKHLNDGICPNCGEPLRHFDTDSQGGDGWTCDFCDKYTVWVSYHKLVYDFWSNHFRRKHTTKA